MRQPRVAVRPKRNVGPILAYAAIVFWLTKCIAGTNEFYADGERSRLFVIRNRFYFAVNAAPRLRAESVEKRTLSVHADDGHGIADLSEGNVRVSSAVYVERNVRSKSSYFPDYRRVAFTFGK